MSEQAPRTEPEQQQFVQEYVQEYPNAVVDPAKAEEMAYASKRDEELVAHDTRQALNLIELAQGDQQAIIDTAANSTDDKHFIVSEAEKEHGQSLKVDGNANEPAIWDTVRDGFTRKANDYLVDAPRFRERADVRADRAGRQYDVKTAAQKLRSGKSLDS